MADETYRPEKRKVTLDDVRVDEGNPMYNVQEVQRAVAEDQRAINPQFDRPSVPQGEASLNVQGNAPQAFLDAIRQQRVPESRPRAEPRAEPPMGQDPLQTNSHLLEILALLDGTTRHYDEVTLPSMGRFYDGTDAPTGGIVHVRQMTGEEEEILARPQYVKKGRAIDMIFEKCVREPIRADRLLGVDRTFLLIYLRGISYTPLYEVEIKCPECDNRFGTTIDLNALEVDLCPEHFTNDSLTGALPTSGFRFRYRLARGVDETQVQNYREKMGKEFGDRADDTTAFRTSLLLDEIEGIADKVQIKLIARKLPINDLNHIRNLVNEPPFGVKTEVELVCPMCLHEFRVDLPFESNFFFPRRQKNAQQT